MWRLVLFKDVIFRERRNNGIVEQLISQGGCTLLAKKGPKQSFFSKRWGEGGGNCTLCLLNPLLLSWNILLSKILLPYQIATFQLEARSLPTVMQWETLHPFSCANGAFDTILGLSEYLIWRSCWFHISFHARDSLVPVHILQSFEMIHRLEVIRFWELKPTLFIIVSLKLALCTSEVNVINTLELLLFHVICSENASYIQSLRIDFQTLRRDRIFHRADLLSKYL